VSSSCECGYRLDENTTFTELQETDLLHIYNSRNPGWTAQSYVVNSTAARGPFGKKADAANVKYNSLMDRNSWDGARSDMNTDAGMQLWVRSEVQKDDIGGAIISGAEISTAQYRNDMLYGSFRARIKVTDVNGTCGSMFWVSNLRLHISGLNLDEKCLHAE
jgi:hypothetical protein